MSETKIDIIYIYFRKLERARPCKRERLPKTTPETETLSKRIQQSEDTCLLPSKEARVKDTIPTIERAYFDRRYVTTPVPELILPITRGFKSMIDLLFENFVLNETIIIIAVETK